MTDITIRNVDDELKRRLEARAAGHGHSLESEARDILRQAVLSESRELTPGNLYEAIRKLVEPFGGIEIELPLRRAGREPPRFE